MAERRKFMRFNAVLNIIYQAVDNSAKKFSSHLSNLSREGMGISGKGALRRGALLEMEMKVPGDNIPIFAAGEVAWSEKSDHNKYNSGIRFTNIESYDRAKLLDFAYNEWVKTKKEKKKVTF